MNLMKLIIRVVNLYKYVTISHVINSTNKREKLSSAYNLILLQGNKMLRKFGVIYSRLRNSETLFRYKGP